MTIETERANDGLRASLLEFNEAMLPLIEFAEGQQATLIERGWSEEAAAQHAFLALCDLRAWWFTCLARNSETDMLRARRMEGLS